MNWVNNMGPVEKAGLLQEASQAFVAGCRLLGRRPWPFTKASVALRTEEWADRLGAEEEFLVSMVHEIEAEFLVTGGGLISLAQQLNEIGTDCQSLTEQTLGQALDSGNQFAFQLLKKAEDLVLASYDQYDHVFATFSELQRRLTRLSKQHDQLIYILLPLNLITITFRIEASRHPPEVQQTFLTLAANVNRTVEEVRGTMQQQFEDLAASERIAQTLIEKISASVRHDRKEVAATLETNRTGLVRFGAALSNSGAGVKDLAELNRAVTRHIEGIVMAQQCQDITRQRIEHVGESMDAMRSHLEEDRPATRAADAEMRHFVFGAAQIQLHQIQDVFQQLDGAAVSLKTGIENLHAESSSAAEVAVKVGGAALDGKLAGQCQDGIGELLAMIQQTVQKITDLIGAFKPLQASFIHCTSKASELAIDVRHAALNAQIFAIHAPDGAALGVLSGRVRAIADEAIHQVGAMGVELDETVEMVSQLQQRLERFQEIGKSEQDVLTGESELARVKLSGIEGSIPALIRQIIQQQKVFTRSVETILSKVQFPATVAQASLRSLAFFEALVAWGAEGGADFVPEPAAIRKLELLKAKYTMDSERQVHAAALRPGPSTATPFEASIERFGEPELSTSSAVAAKPAASEDLGDNVELF